MNRNREELSKRSRGLTRQMVRLAWVPMAGMSLISCGTKINSEVTESQESTTGAVTQSNTIALTVPSNVDPNKLVVGGDSTVSLNDRVKIAGLVAQTQPPAGALRVSGDAKLNSIVAGGNVTLGARTAVAGDVTAGGSVSRPSSSSVSGTIRQNANLGAPRVIQWAYAASGSNQGNVIANAGSALDLVPGAYGNLTLNGQSSVTLHTGTYVFGNINVGSQSKLLVDSVRGPAQVYSGGQFTFGGSVATATAGIPQLLVGLTGTTAATVPSPFVGVLLAPNATLNVQAALPVGHRAIFYAKDLVVQPDAVVNPYPFSWGFILPSLEPKLDPSAPIHSMPRSVTDMPVHIDKDGHGTATSTRTSSTVVSFKLPQSYPVEGGIIGNGKVIFTFQTGSASAVTCTYLGGASTSKPSTQAELNAGRLLKFQSCTDGLPVTTRRQGTKFTLSVSSVVGYPVTVDAPVVADAACSDTMELLSAQETQQMYESFSWTTARATSWPGGDKVGHVAANNTDGTPALYYAWVYLHTPEDALNLRKLYVHELGTPLFQEELDKFAGMCGAISNPGDGVGAFVPVVMTGLTYNHLIDAFTASNLSGDRQIFEAVIIRQVPAGAANSNGSISYSALANAGFSYLDYESKPLADPDSITQFHSAVHAVVSVIKFVGQGLKDVATPN